MTLTKWIGSAAALGVAVLIGLPEAYAAPTSGKACHATSKGGDQITINDGTYNDNGECCSPRLNNAPPGTPIRQCIVCDNPNNTCGDGKVEK